MYQSCVTRHVFKTLPQCLLLISIFLASKLAIRYLIKRNTLMSYKLSRHLIALCASLATALMGGLYYDLAISILSPLGLRMLAISTWLLLLLSLTLLAFLFISYFEKTALARQVQIITAQKNLEIDQLKTGLATYNPEHFEDKEFEKHFNEFTDKLDKNN